MNKIFLTVSLIALFSLSSAQTPSGFLSNGDEQNVENHNISFLENFHLLINENGEGKWVGENEGEFISEGWMNEEGAMHEEGWLAEEWINIEGLGEELVVVELDPIGWWPENEPSDVNVQV